MLGVAGAARRLCNGESGVVQGGGGCKLGNLSVLSNQDRGARGLCKEG